VAAASVFDSITKKDVDACYSSDIYCSIARSKKLPEEPCTTLGGCIHTSNTSLESGDIMWCIHNISFSTSSATAVQ